MDKGVCVDLGCGATRRCPGDYKCIGIDCHSCFRPDILCKLGFEKIPLEDSSIDMAVAYDFLEHIPTVVYYKEDGEWEIHSPRIFLLREVYRILKPGGTFESHTPGYGNRAWAQDPTHCSPPWTDETWNYFCGGYCTGMENHPYGLDFAFEKVSVESDEISRITAVIRKPKKESNG